MEFNNRLREVELALAKLNGSLPELNKRLDNAVEKIEGHEANAAKRWNEHLSCMVKREKATSDITTLKWIITSIILLNAGMIITLISKAFAK
ncbi:MAG: hypothetical protein FJW63_01830 [Actinobacteria bacterium]|nr:hypothetical protein [Actinomycetota bacterium]